MIIHCVTLTAYRPCSGGKGGGDARAAAAADTGADGDPAAGDTDAAAATATEASVVAAEQDAEAAVLRGNSEDWANDVTTTGGNSRLMQYRG